MKEVTIKVGLSITRNIGNYESLRIEAGIEYPVADIPGNALEVYLSTYKLLENIIKTESSGLADRLRDGSSGSKCTIGV